MAKWINKQRQAISEKVSKSTDKTEFEPGFLELEKQTDATKNVIDKLVKFIPNYLHPNPAARTMRSMGTAMAKITKTAAEKRYPHVAGEIAEIMVSGGGELDGDSHFGQSLLEVGEVFNQINEAQHSFDAEVNQNFLDPLRMVVDRDIKEILKHRKKLEGRRLDYDFKRRKQPSSGGKITDADMKIAEQKLEESKGLYESGMVNLLDSDVEQVGQLSAFVEANLNFFRTAVQMLEACSESLADKLKHAGSRPKRETTAKVVKTYDDDDDDDDDRAPPPKASTPSSGGRGGASRPSARANFDFEAENDGELSFKEGETIYLTSRLDENWLEGEVGGRAGIFPANYVDIIVDV